MKKKKLFSGLLALALVCTTATPVFATDINVSGGTSSVPVELSVDAATFSVTVPTALPIDIDANGEVTTVPATIINNSHGAVKVTNMTISGVGDWEIIDFDSADMASEKVGATKLAMTINGDKTTADDTITFTASNFPKMDGVNETDSDELPIYYYAMVPAQATAINNLNVANVVFTIGWDELSNEMISFTVSLKDKNGIETQRIYEARKEMTWKEWTESKYNVDNFYANEYGVNCSQLLEDRTYHVVEDVHQGDELENGKIYNTTRYEFPS